MARPISQHVQQVRQLLEGRLRDGFHRPGDRFLSNRAVAAQYGISYQTAQRLLTQLVEDDLLVRRRGAGTYLPGHTGRLTGVELLFNSRARMPGSFGARLLKLMRSRLDRLSIETTVHLLDPARPLPPPGKAGTLPAILPTTLPVIWDLPLCVQSCATHNRRAVILNDRPASGFASTLIDSVSVDDFTGGACAAQMLASASRVVILAGPKDDIRSQQRVAGFLSIRRAHVIPAGGWFVEHGAAHAQVVLRRKPDAVFCCNDRLAESIVRHCLEHQLTPPSLIGFDDAPIAAKLHLSTIAIPWAELVNAAARTILARLSGDRSAAIRQIVAPYPIRRN